MQDSNGESWKFPEIDTNLDNRCPNMRTYKGKKLCIILKKVCSGWSLQCALRGMKVGAKLYNLWKDRGYL